MSSVREWRVTLESSTNRIEPVSKTMLTGHEMARNIHKKCQKNAGDISNNTEKLCSSESSVITLFFINSSDSGIVLPVMDKATLITALGNTFGCTKESNKYLPSLMKAAPRLEMGS